MSNIAAWGLNPSIAWFTESFNIQLNTHSFLHSHVPSQFPLFLRIVLVILMFLRYNVLLLVTMLQFSARLSGISIFLKENGGYKVKGGATGRYQAAWFAKKAITESCPSNAALQQGEDINPCSTCEKSRIPSLEGVRRVADQDWKVHIAY